jgi:hypothetical protein
MLARIALAAALALTFAQAASAQQRIEGNVVSTTLTRASQGIVSWQQKRAQRSGVGKCRALIPG